MKFNVEKKDFVIFVIYSTFLLYICAIVVLNFTSLANEGSFYGLLPFKAFTKDYIIVTFVLFILAQIIIFTSVSSYIFDKERGSFGFSVGNKKSDGYSKWANKREIIKQKDVVKTSPLEQEVEGAGIPLINNGKEIYVDDGEYHNLVIGSTGSGKTECLVKPMVNLLARNGESMIITDPKGELYKYTAETLKNKGYNVVLLNFRDPQRGNAWNPLMQPYSYYKNGNFDKATELLDDVALNILYEEGPGPKDPFWERTSADYFAGLSLALFEDAQINQINLNSINYMSTIGEERYAASSTYIKEYFTLKGEESKPYIFASATISAPSDTKGSILSTFRQKIRKFSTTDNLSEMLSHSDFDMRDIGQKKTAVFLVIHDEKKTYHSLMTIFIKQCYETLIDVAHENGGKLPFRTNFILDEFANMPPLKDVDAMISAARSRLIRFTFIIQNYAQLSDVYGEHVAEIIKGNCSNLVYLISTELKALEEISKIAGEQKSKEKDKTASTPLITVTDLQKLKLFEAVLIRIRTSPFRTHLKPNFKMDWGEEFIPAQYPERKKKEVKTFDVKKFVTEEKKKKAIELQKERKDSGISETPMDRMSPFAPTNPFSMGRDVGSVDINQMMKDIDRKLQELEEQEKGEREEQPIAREETSISKPEKTSSKDIKLNIDTDSKVFDENIVTDDEYFDDFFD